MKRKLFKLFTALLVITCICGSYKTYGFAFTTWEEAREWFRENGIPVSQGGTYDEYSISQGEIEPSNNNQLSSAKPVEVPKQPVHEHSYIETVTTEPTCIEEGVKTFTCSCGEKYTEPIKVVAHDYNKEIVSQEATCTANGKKLISCIVCNDTYEEEIRLLVLKMAKK